MEISLHQSNEQNVQKYNANQINDQELEIYLKKPNTFLDWVLIIGLILLTYAITLLILWGFIAWATSDSKNSDSFKASQIFSLILFIAYLVICGILWRIFIGRRDQMKDELIKKKLKMQETL